jgi:hypothetical protein
MSRIISVGRIFAVSRRPRAIPHGLALFGQKAVRPELPARCSQIRIVMLNAVARMSATERRHHRGTSCACHPPVGAFPCAALGAGMDHVAEIGSTRGGHLLGRRRYVMRIIAQPLAFC